MKMQEVRELTDEELRRYVREHRQEIFDLRLQAQTGQLENAARIKNAKRRLARLLAEHHSPTKETRPK